MANVLANTARSIVTSRLSGGGTEPKQIGWGTGAGTAAATDTTLFSEKALDLSATTGSRTAGTSNTTTGTNATKIRFTRLASRKGRERYRKPLPDL